MERSIHSYCVLWEERYVVVKYRVVFIAYLKTTIAYRYVTKKSVEMACPTGDKKRIKQLIFFLGFL